MKYIAANGITPAVELTEAQALEDYRRARSDPEQVVDGMFGEAFTVYLVGADGAGRRVAFAATAYRPLADG